MEIISDARDVQNVQNVRDIQNTQKKLRETGSSRQHEVITKDIFLTAYLLTGQAVIKEIVTTEDNRGSCSLFVLEGPDAAEHEKEYANGTARANVRELKESLRNVKDIMFDRIRSLRIGQTTRSKEPNHDIYRRVH